MYGLKLMQQFIAASEELLPAKYSIVVNSKSCLFDWFSNVLILLSLDFLGSSIVQHTNLRLRHEHISRTSIRFFETS